MHTLTHQRNFLGNCCCFHFSRPPWRHHLHLCDCHLTANKHTYFAFSSQPKKTLLGSCSRGLRPPFGVFTPAFSSCFAKWWQCTAVRNRSFHTHQTSFKNKRFYGVQPACCPSSNFHVLSAGGITPCLPQLPFGLPHHLLLTSCAAAGSRNSSSPSSSSWKSVCSGGGSLTVSAIFAFVSAVYCSDGG